MWTSDDFCNQDYHVPDRIGEVIAWRKWHVAVDRDDTPLGYHYISQLKSTNCAYIWKPGINTFDCNRFGAIVGYTQPQKDRHLEVQPNSMCHCGFYALKPGWTGMSGGVKGVVGLSGRIVEGTRGYRAQYARILALGVSNAHKYQEGFFFEIAEYYGVPLIDWPEWPDLPELWREAVADAKP